MRRIYGKLRLYLTLVVVGMAALSLWGLFSGRASEAALLGQLLMVAALALVSLRLVNDLRRVTRRADALLTEARQEAGEQETGEGESAESLGDDKDSGNERHTWSEEKGILAAQNEELATLSSVVADHSGELGSVVEGLRSVEKEMTKRSQWAVDTIIRQLESSIGLYAILSPGRVLPFSRGWAACPDLLGLIVNEIFGRESPPRVLECGSGLSTVVIANALARRGDGGNVVSLEHDEVFLEQTRLWLGHRSLDCAEVRFAPLTEIPFIGTGGGVKDASVWYDPAAVAGEEGINLLVVDGPPGRASSHIRYPALPIVRESLSRDAVIIVDDIKRADDSDTLHAWSDMLGVQPEIHRTEKGTGILRLEG